MIPILILTVLAALGVLNAVAAGWLIDIPETTTTLRAVRRLLAWVLLEQPTRKVTP